MEEVEQDVRNGQKLDSNAVINNMLFNSGRSGSHFDIPLYKMIGLLLVHPLL